MTPSDDVVRHLNLDFGFSYVLILEWLMAGEDRTGLELHAFLGRLGIPSQLVVCNTWPEIRSSLVLALANVADKGIPAVHLETHGTNPWRGVPEDIGFGAPNSESAAWTELGALLAPLNVASEFRLLVVSAACWGLGIIAAIDGG